MTIVLQLSMKTFSYRMYKMKRTKFVLVFNGTLPRLSYLTSDNCKICLRANGFTEVTFVMAHNICQVMTSSFSNFFNPINLYWR